MMGMPFPRVQRADPAIAGMRVRPLTRAPMTSSTGLSVYIAPSPSARIKILGALRTAERNLNLSSRRVLALLQAQRDQSSGRRVPLERS